MGGDHPLHPVRLDLTMRLADSLGVLATDRVECSGPRRPTPCSPWCTTRLPRGGPAAPTTRSSGTAWARPDNPIFEGMYEAAALIAGGRVLAAQQVAQPGPSTRSTSPAACTTRCATRASGFCVFNDAAVAIAWLLGQGYERIAYVDVDVHHGDGVQAAFYDDPRVLTVALHQTPLTLFPGTGFPEETGDPERRRAARSTWRCPTAPRTRAGCGPSTRSSRRAAAFRPQILVTQCGADAHQEDPLADLALTVDGQRASLPGDARPRPRAVRRALDRPGRRRVRAGPVRAAGLDPPDRRGRRDPWTRPPRPPRRGATTSSAAGYGPSRPRT